MYINIKTIRIVLQVLAWQTSWWCDSEYSIEPQGDIDKQLMVMLAKLEEMLGSEQVNIVHITYICRTKCVYFLIHMHTYTFFHKNVVITKKYNSCIFLNNKIQIPLKSCEI